MTPPSAPAAPSPAEPTPPGGRIVFEVADDIACLYLGALAAQVPAKDVNHSRVVELITTGRSGDLGLQPEIANAGGVA